jgi:hypothetical protein
MPDPRLLAAIAVVAWLCAFIGSYRVLFDADVLGRGVSAETMTPAYRAQVQARMLKAFLSPKHKIDRFLIVGGALVFFGVIGGMIPFASPPSQ